MTAMFSSAGVTAKTWNIGNVSGWAKIPDVDEERKSLCGLA